MSEKLENFERAFASGSGGCVRTCECGHVFFDGLQTYDWEPGELESLLEKTGTTSTELDYTVSTIVFEGKEYCADCKCWHPRAERIMDWLKTHDTQIAQFLTLEKRRLKAEAEASPEVA